MLRRAGLLIVVASLPCVSALAPAQGTGGSAPMSCATAAAPQMTPFDTTRVTELAGAFDVLMVDTTSIRVSARQHTGKLALWLQDSLPRRRGMAARRAQKQFLVGSFDAALPDTGEVWRRMASRTADAPGVFWSDGFLRLGEFGAKSGISLYVRSVSAAEIRGMWTSSPGIGIIVDFTGDREPDEAGFFCARRMR
ncbi:MAG TPA: hypothetical protein VIK50_13380 [Gemmatimonadaceae bacterium]